MVKTRSSQESSPLLVSSKDSNSNESDDVHIRIAGMRQLMQETHASRRNFRLDWRLDQLSRLQRMVDDHWDEILEVLNSDLGKCREEAGVLEMAAASTEFSYLKSNLAKWMQPQHVPSPASLFPAYSKVTPMPRNGPAVLVIGPSNYPISISLMAVAGSLAAGNPTVLKPSELCPASAKLLSKCIPEYFEASALQVVEGGIPETTALLAQDWGLIHFTGSERVGRIVASAAAKTLTPVVLELGGKCPCYVDESCPSDISQVANRIIWSKTVNCGQNCISPDYLLIHKSQVDGLLPELTRALEEQFGTDSSSPSTASNGSSNSYKSQLSKLVAPSHVQRAVDFIQEIEEMAKTDKHIQILSGGSSKCDKQSGYVAPTIILNAPLDSRIMKEEIFSPILPILVVNDRDQAVEIINSMDGTPLGLYVFTKSEAVFREMTERCRSGTAVRNDLIVQFAGPHLPFGGLGTSGMGSYRGENSFRCFSHMLPCVHRLTLPGADLCSLRCQPFVPWKSFILSKLVPMAPSIPVLITGKRAAVVVLLAVAVTNLVPGADVTIRSTLASVLRKAADGLSR